MDRSSASASADIDTRVCIAHFQQALNTSRNMDCKEEEFFEEEELLKRIKQCVAAVEEEAPRHVSALYISVQKYFLMCDGEIFYDRYSQRIDDPAHSLVAFEDEASYYFQAKLEGSDWKVFFAYEYDDKKLYVQGIGKEDESVLLQFEHQMDSNNLDHLLNDQRDGWFRDTNNGIPLNELDRKAFERFCSISHRLGL